MNIIEEKGRKRERRMAQCDISRAKHSTIGAVADRISITGANHRESDNGEIFVLNRDLNERKQAILI